ncbi:MAG: LUD domain-containing protein [Saprospiraceae bacterium]
MSKEKILARIRANKPAATDLPTVPLFPMEVPDLVHTFTSIAEKGFSKCISLADAQDLGAIIGIHYPEAQKIASCFSGFSGNIDLAQVTHPSDLNDVDLAIIPGQIGVAENGAIWVSEAECPHRVLPFITQHLLLTLYKDQLVWNLHEAYQQIKIDATGFGVFIAGPSKTADIEQSLVIGAQGARSLTIILLDQK